MSFVGYEEDEFASHLLLGETKRRVAPPLLLSVSLPDRLEAFLNLRN
jgi:hypothetical protein